MLLNNKTYTQNRQGFSLTELLVAMTILVTVMGGLGALYAGAVRSFKTGKEISKNFENSRSLLHVMDQDLSKAFSAAEFGDSFKFHGTEAGFTFIGINANNKIGRITYAANPNAQPLYFETTVMESYADVRSAVQAQTTDWLVSNGYLLTTSAQDEQLLGDIAFAVGVLFDNFFDTSDLIPDAEGDYAYEFDLVVRTQGIIRYGEFAIQQEYFDSNGDPQKSDLTNISAAFQDLNSFRAVYPNGAPIIWPVFDPLDPYNDCPNPPECQNSTVIDGVVEAPLYDYVISAISPPARQIDLREELINLNDNGSGLATINPDLVEKIINMKRREFWIRWIADDPELFAWANRTLNSVLPRFWSDNPDDPFDNRPDLRDYIISDGILREARLKSNDVYFDFEVGQLLDSLGYTTDETFILNLTTIPGVFRYTTAEGAPLATFNDTQNLAGFLDYQFDSSMSLGDWDDQLYLDVSAQRQSVTATGSPIKPGLPSMVQPGYFVMTEKVTPGSPDFKRWFSQQVEIHAGSNRSMSNRVAPNKDQT